MNKGILILLPAVMAMASTPAMAGPAPSVVELFTSQGCSSCPPADMNLAELAKHPDVVALGFHVTYWNNLGWIDPLSTTWATARQNTYAAALGHYQVSTPQMMVDGTMDVVGSDDVALRQALDHSRDMADRRVSLDLRRSAGHLEIAIPALKLSSTPATIIVAGYDRPHVTNVQAGENDGRKLRDANAVRVFEVIGSWDGSAATHTVDLAAIGISPAMGVAVLIQLGPIDARPGAIVGAGKLDPAPSS
jgi:hypothetical protein